MAKPGNTIKTKSLPLPEQTIPLSGTRLESGKQKHHGINIFNHKIR